MFPTMLHKPLNILGSLFHGINKASNIRTISFCLASVLGCPPLMAFSELLLVDKGPTRPMLYFRQGVGMILVNQNVTSLSCAIFRLRDNL